MGAEMAKKAVHKHLGESIYFTLDIFNKVVEDKQNVKAFNKLNLF